MHPSAWRLVAVTDPALWGGRVPGGVLGDALSGGVSALLLRLRDWDVRQVLNLAETIAPLCRASGAALIVHQHAGVAAAVGAAGVHVTSTRPDVAAARAALSAGQVVGVSCHSVREARAAEAAGADYVFLGPVYATPSKAEFGAPLGLEVVRAACAAVRIPVIGIGGIAAHSAADVRAAGAAGVAVIRAVFAAADVTGAAADLVAALGLDASASSSPKCSS